MRLIVVVCIGFFFLCCVFLFYFFFFQAEDGIRDLVRSRGLGDVYKRQVHAVKAVEETRKNDLKRVADVQGEVTALRKRIDENRDKHTMTCLLYTSDAADERSSVDLGGRRIIKKKKKVNNRGIHRVKEKSRTITDKVRDRLKQ